MTKVFVDTLWRGALGMLASLALLSCKSKDGTPDVPKQTGPDHLLIEEVFYVGTWVNQGGDKGYLYDRDNYIKIHNPTDRVMYLDKLALVRSVFQSDNQLELSPDGNFISTHLNVDAIIQFPGSGQEYPIQPKESVLLASAAVDHRTDKNTSSDPEERLPGNPNSIDLTKAKFEWYTSEQIKNEYSFEENTSVPNMIPIYSDGDFGGEVYEPLTLRGTGALALVRLEASVEDLKKDEYKWSWVSNKTSGSHTHARSGMCLKLPNAWVIDLVNICPKSEYKWAIVDRNTIDAGSVDVYERRSGANHQSIAGKAIRRKHDGRSYVDTNNSTVDFEVRTASLLQSK